MAPRPPPPPAPPPSPLRRLEEALAESQKSSARRTKRRGSAREQEGEADERALHREQWKAWARREGARHMEAWEERWAGRKQRRKWERQERRERQRALKHQRRLEQANPLQGWVFAAVALVLAGMAVFSEKWWLIFVALGMGSSAANILGRVHERSRLGRESSPEAPSLPEETVTAEPAARPPEAADPRTARVDALCDKLLAELRAGPGVLRDVVHQPEPTVEGLRRGCHELVRRERELRALASPEDERRLEEERARLAARVVSEPDAVVRERLEKTLRLLDTQRQQRAELATAASRLEAEHMRLYYTLENLYTQVLRVRSADAASADVAGAGLRQSVEQLGVEMDAVAEALEEVHRDGPLRERVPTR